MLIQICALLLGGVVGATPLQEGAGSSDREQQKLLELRRAQVRVREARAEFNRQENLYEQGLTPQSALERSRAGLTEARINYQQVFLELFRESSRLSVLEAIKSTTPQGGRYVALRLENSSGAHLDYKQLGVDAEDAPLPDALRIRELRNIFVSLRDQDGRGCGQAIPSANRPSRCGRNDPIALRPLKGC